MDSLRGQPSPESRVRAEHIDRSIQEKLQLISELDDKILNDIKTQGRATNRRNPRSCQLSKSKERRNKTSSSDRGRRIEEERNFSDQFERI